MENTTIENKIQATKKRQRKEIKKLEREVDILRLKKEKRDLLLALKQTGE